MHALRGQRSGFTLIEIIIAAAIVLLLAGMVVPVFDGAIADAEAASTRQILERARTAVNFYAFQHEDQLPGESGGIWSAQTFLDQLRLATDENGDTAPVGTPGFPYGPYLTDDLGTNPFNDLSTIMILAPGDAMDQADDSTGWVFFAETGDFRANASCEDPNGDPVWEL
jgi:prepilin-type N-terminal cleavage/methylation domain-containing protein